MSHSSDTINALEPLRVETDNRSVTVDNSNYFEEKDNFSQTIEDNDSLGPLPPKWEKAYTESGEVYFIE